MNDMNPGRTWSNAPAGGRDARALAWLGVIFSGLILMLTIAIVSSTAFQGGFRSLVLVIYSLFFPFYIWLLIGLKRGTKAAYYVQMIVAIIGLIGFPIGTLINGYILFKWFRPETKAWFGV